MLIKMTTGKIVDLDWKNSLHRRAAANLHAELLPDSFVARMGRLFMERFYYRDLVREGLIRCDLFLSGDQAVGLSAYTLYPYDFMDRGKRKFFLKLAVLTILSFVLQPARLGAVLSISRLSKKRDLTPRDKKVGEYLSLAVRASHAADAEESTGLRASQALFARAADFLKSQGCRRMFLVIKKTNFFAMRFHRERGAVPIEGDFVPEDCSLLAVTLG